MAQRHRNVPNTAGSWWCSWALSSHCLVGNEASVYWGPRCPLEGWGALQRPLAAVAAVRRPSAHALSRLLTHLQMALLGGRPPTGCKPPPPPPPCCTFVAHSLKTYQSSQAVAGKTKAQTRECGGSNNGLSWVQLRRVGGTAAALRVTAGLHGPALLPIPCSFALFPSESPIQGSLSTGLPSPCLPNSMYPAKDPELTS